MKNLIIIFNKMDIATAFNEGVEDCVDDYLYDSDSKTGFSEDFDYFHRLLPTQPIIGNTFPTNGNGFKNEVSHSEILLIHVSNKVNEWDNDFKEQFANYSNQFEKVYISYHESDMESGKHKLIEDIINKPPVLPEKYHHHEYEYGTENEEQIYGFLAKAIVENEGVFNTDTYNNTIEKLISFFPSNEEIYETSLLNKKLTFLHNLLGDNLDNESIQKQLEGFNCTKSFDKKFKHNSIQVIRDQILNEY